MIWGSMKGQRFPVLMLCQGRVVEIPSDPVDWSLLSSDTVEFPDRCDGFLAPRSDWEMGIDYARPKDAVNVLKTLAVWLAISISQPTCIRPVSILHEVAYLVSDGRG